MPESNNDKSVQETIEDAMPTFPEDGREFSGDDEFAMTADEQRNISQLFEAIIQQLYDQGYSQSELGVVINGFGHRMNATRYRPHEYDRIALSIELRETIETWREEQDGDVPVLAIADAVEEMGRHYRHMARREVYSDDE